MDYSEFARALYNTNVISDPWINGKERFSLEPILLNKNTYRNLCWAAEEIAYAYQELTEIVLQHQELLDDYFNLTPYQKLIWLSSKGKWHGISRVDLFILNDGTIKMAEMNSDTPSGEAETVLINDLLYKDYTHLINPNTMFVDRFLYLIDFNKKQLINNGISACVGIVYPTEMTEDLSMIAIYKNWMEKHDYKVILGSPFNLELSRNKSLYLLDNKIDILFRHYKTDWWGERIPVYTDEFYPDSEPLDSQLKSIISAEISNNLQIINPLGAVITQNKLTMAFFWENFGLFSKKTQKIIHKYIPKTLRTENINFNEIEKNDWVLKSNYGCEGTEVIIGRYVTEAIWNETIEKMIRKYWVIQQFFEAETINNLIPNYGLYLICGRASGVFTRLSEQATDYYSKTAATFIE